MKTVFKSDEIAHIWANKSAPFGRSASALSFDGVAIKSYQAELARFITHKGKEAIVLNDRSYSVTTSKHQSWVRQAIPSGVPVFRWSGRNYLGDVTGKELFEYAAKESADCLAKASRAKGRKGWHQSEAARWLELAKDINAFFGLRRKVDEKTIERLRAESEAAEAKRRKEVARREAAEALEQRAAYQAWLEGAEVREFNSRLFPVAFRVEGDELVSTLGARVPVTAAKVALRFVRSHREAGWHRNGETHAVGNYQLEAVNPQGVVAGCHRIAWAEIDRLNGILA